MITFDRSVITDRGRALINLGETLNISRIGTGDGDYSSTENLNTRTALKSAKYYFVPSSKETGEDGTKVSAILSNYDPVTEGAIVDATYTIKEVGIYAEVNGAEELFALCISYTGERMPAYTGSNKTEMVCDWVISVSGDADVTITTRGAAALASDLTEHKKEVVLSDDGVHGIRAVKEDDEYKIQIKDGNDWSDAGGGGTTIVPVPVAETTEYTYDGDVHNLTFEYLDYKNIILENASATAAGRRIATATLKGSNMVWSDMTTAPKTYEWVINKAAGSISVNPTTMTLNSNSISGNLDVCWTGDGAVSIVSSDTSVLTVSPSSMSSEGTALMMTTGKTGNVTVTATLAEGDNYLGGSASCTVSCEFVPIKTFAAATLSEIKQMVEAADAGQIDLYEDCGWRVGQENTISLAAIASSGTYDGVSWSVGESQSAQSVTLVLMHRGLYQLVSPVKSKGGASRSTCSFVVGLKNSLATSGYMNSSNTNTGSWNSSARRNWCNGGFRQAMPEAIRGCFKKFKTVTAATYDGSSNQTSEDYFALPAAAEVYKGDSSYGTGGSAGKTTAYSNLTEFNALTRFTYYETTANRVKKLGDTGSAYNWWERSPYYTTGGSGFCYVGSNGNADYNRASNTYGLAPIGCL